VRVARGVAVAGWGWYRWKEEVTAVRLVVFLSRGCGYWPCSGSAKMGHFFLEFFVFFWNTCYLCCACGLGSGSGWVIVVPLERGDRCGSNGVKMSVWLLLLRVAVAVGDWALFFFFFFLFFKKKNKHNKDIISYCHLPLCHCHTATYHLPLPLTICHLPLPLPHCHCQCR
jgi:hypothetical protein